MAIVHKRAEAFLDGMSAEGPEGPPTKQARTDSGGGEPKAEEAKEEEFPRTPAGDRARARAEAEKAAKDVLMVALGVEFGTAKKMLEEADTPEGAPPSAPQSARMRRELRCARLCSQEEGGDRGGAGEVPRAGGRCAGQRVRAE